VQEGTFSQLYSSELHQMPNLMMDVALSRVLRLEKRLQQDCQAAMF
jgi:hypothetical protein